MSDKIRLNIGAGASNLSGFTPIDIKDGIDASGKLPYADGSVDEVYASHVLEHIHHSKTSATLTEWVRVLRPGGRLRIAVPNFGEIRRQQINGQMPLTMVNAWMHGTNDVDTDRHVAEFDEESLVASLRRLGIENPSRWEPQYDDCSRLPLSLNLGGYKRETRINPKPKVALALSTGRFGPIDLYSGVCDLCRIQGWPLYQWGGDNWAKALTCTIRKALNEQNPDYIVTLDFDSCFNAGEVAKMIDFMQEHPEVAACWPVQAHRHTDLPLGFAWDAAVQGYYDFSKDNPWKGEFTPHGSGHFGCTVIRRQVFDTMPQPWLAGLPNPNTMEWDEGALDNDIAFWVGMTGHGFLFGQLNTVQIGHMELCAKWVAGDKIMWQPIQNWRRNGRPKQAVFDGEGWVRRAFTRLEERMAEQGMRRVNADGTPYIDPPASPPEAPAPRPPVAKIVEVDDNELQESFNKYKNGSRVGT